MGCFAVAATLTALVLSGCGGGGTASGDAWNVTNAEIRHLIAEIKPREAAPGCDPNQEEIEGLRGIIDDREKGEPASGPFQEGSAKAAEEGGYLLLTREQERIACSRTEAFEHKVEAEQKRMAQEAGMESTPRP